MQLDADPRILTAVENAVAASRWRTAARFEGPETAARFRRQAEVRRAAATANLTSFAKTGRGQSPASLGSTRTTTQGG